MDVTATAGIRSRTPDGRVPLAAGLLALTLLAPAVLPLSAARASAVPEAQSGEWQERQVRFDYLGAASGTPYSCQGLRDMTTLVLQTLGDVSNLHAEPGNCIPDFARPSRFPYLTLRFKVFVPAAGGADQAAAGRWRTVTLAPHHPFPLGTGDCELVDELRAKLLPQLAVRDVQSQLHCEPYEAVSWALTLQVFAPVAKPRP